MAANRLKCCCRCRKSRLSRNRWVREGRANFERKRRRDVMRRYIHQVRRKMYYGATDARAARDDEKHVRVGLFRVIILRRCNCHRRRNIRKPRRWSFGRLFVPALEEGRSPLKTNTEWSCLHLYLNDTPQRLFQRLFHPSADASTNSDINRTCTAKQNILLSHGNQSHKSSHTSSL